MQPRSLSVTFRLQIPLGEIEYSFSRSSGPGGQNVNKVNSKATLRWNLPASAIDAEMKALLAEKLGAKLSRDGDYLVSSDRFRDQARNRDDCLEKFRQALRQAAQRPKKRKPTKATFSSRRRAHDDKKRHSEKKRMRRESC